MPFTTSRIIQFGDCDPGGVVYTPRIAHFVAEAGLEFLSYALEGPAARSIFAMDILPPARALSMEFLHPMTWDERIDIEVSVKEIRNQSFSLFLSARNANKRETFRATIAQVSISPRTKRPVPLPAALRAALQRTQALAN